MYLTVGMSVRRYFPAYIHGSVVPQEMEVCKGGTCLTHLTVNV